MPAASPYLVNVRDLERRPGELRERELDLNAPDQLGAGAAVVTAGTPVHIDLRLESLHEGILATGDVDSAATGECVRCLDSVSVPVRVEFQELFAYSDDEAFDYRVRDDHVDLEPVVRDAVVLSLPFQPVCRPDCPGLDPATGEKLADDPEQRPAAIVDPRWAALEGFAPVASGIDGGDAVAEEEKR
ncbi:MAG: DUF177 domain-containing protein [Micrococcales bacterium]|nr:DUF177 domain-containing protein [Micrococcales bacterium]